MIMKKLWCLCILGLITVNLVYAQQASDLVSKVKSKLDKVNDYKAQAELKMDVSFIDAPDSKVVVYFKKPDKFKVVKNGGISILPKGGMTVNPATLPANNNYDAVAGKDTKTDGIDTKVVKLLPRDENSNVVLTTLYIDEKNLVIRKATVVTKDNGSYDIDLNYGKFINWALPDKVTFSFNTSDYKLPKGITFEYEKCDKKKADVPKNKVGKVEIVYSGYVINKGIDDKLFR